MTHEEICVAILPSGLRVVSEHVPDSRTVSLGIWAAVGSRDEPDELAGVSHFLEHLLFKGTSDRSAREIAESVDSVGGDMNAFTARELTAFHVRLPSEHCAFGVDLLADVVAQPALRAADVACERQVILDELRLADEVPEDRVQSLLLEASLPGHPLGREIIGERGSVARISRDDVARFHHHWYRPANLVLAAAGAVDHDELVELVSERFVGTGGEAPQRRLPERFRPAVIVERRETDEAHVAFAWAGVGYRDDRRTAAVVADQIVGGGLSSRLFQEVRERRGLAYSVYSAPAMFSDGGLFTVATATAPERIEQATKVIAHEIGLLVSDGVTEREVEVAKGYLTGSVVLGLEESWSRMARLGQGTILRGSVTPLDEYLAAIEAVTVDDVNAVIRSGFGGPCVVAAVGQVDERRLHTHT